MSETPVDSIKVGDRFRKDVGDIKELADSIVEVGLIHPIVVDSDNNLIAGYRRLMAYKYLLWREIPVTVIDEDAQLVEIHENTQRKPFTVSEVKAIYDHLHPKLETKAKERMLSGQPSSKLDKGRTDETIAKVVGVGKDTLRKIIVIAEEGKPEEIQEADGRSRLVNNIYNKIKKRKKLEKAHMKGSPPMPVDIYDIIYADPPWKFRFSECLTRTVEQHYSTMETEDIADLAIPSSENAVLFLWVINSHLEEGLTVLKSWGFEYITNFVWVKDKIGLGYYHRGQHELLLICKKGKMPFPETHSRFSSVIQAPRKEHSAKPETVYEMIEAMYPNRRYLELFSRNSRQGWAMWGNELPDET